MKPKIKTAVVDTGAGAFVWLLMLVAGVWAAMAEHPWWAAALIVGGIPISYVFSLGRACANCGTKLVDLKARVCAACGADLRP